jgi:hypothetical protein
MTNETRDSLQALWHAQEVATLEYDMHTIIARATELDTQVRRRNTLELLAGGSAGTIFLAFFGLAVRNGQHPVLLLGLLTIIVATIFVMTVLQRFGKALHLPDPSVAASEFVAAHRNNLVRQRDLLRRAWLWYVLPFLVGFALLDLGRHLERGLPLDAWSGSWFLLGATGVCAAIAVLNRVAAHRLGRQLEQLDD